MNNCGHLGKRPTCKEEGGLCIKCNKFICTKCKSDRSLDICFKHLENLVFGESRELLDMNQVNKLTKTFEKVKELSSICNTCNNFEDTSFFKFPMLRKINNKYFKSKPFFRSCPSCSEHVQSFLRSLKSDDTNSTIK